MVRRRAFFIDAGYTVKKGKTYVTLILKGKKTVRLYYRYDPYLLVDAPVERKEEFLDIQVQRKDGEMAGPLDVEVIERGVGLGKKKLIKLICKQPSDVPLMKRVIPFPCFEYSIPFTRRFIFDMQLSPFHIVSYEREGRIIKRILSVKEPDKPPEINALAFDIETYNPMGAPREQKDPVIMISYCGKGRKGVLTFKGSKGDFVERLGSEKEMLERFSQIVQEEDPDALVGYNSGNFDLPYLEARAKQTGAKLRLGRFGGRMRPLTKGLTKGYEIGGRVHFDLYPIARLFGFIGVIKAQKFTLDAVAEDVLGKKKVSMDKKSIWELWDSGDIDMLCEYSLVDSELAYGLSERFLPLEMEMSSVAKMPLFQTSLSTSGQLVENLLMYSAAQRKEVVPPRPVGETVYERINAPIQGAFVKLPEPGIYENLAVLDFRGLYPSIIISYNIDPGTLLEDGEEGAYVSPTGAVFSRKRVGLVPYVLDSLVQRRGEIKNALKTIDKSSDDYTRMMARSQALKILANSIAGDEPLLLKDPQGDVRIMDANEFIDCRLGDDIVGSTRLGDAEGWEAACFIDKKIVFRGIRKLMRHKARKLLEIKMKSGRRLKITEGHSVFTLDEEGDVTPIRGRDLEKGGIVAVPRKMDGLETKRAGDGEINLIKALAEVPDEETEDIVLDIRLGQEAKELHGRHCVLEELEDGEESYSSAIAMGIGLDSRAVTSHLERLRFRGYVEGPCDPLSNPRLYRINEDGRRYRRFIKRLVPNLRYNGNNRMHFVRFNDIKAHVSSAPDSLLREFRIGPMNGTKIDPGIKITEKLARLLGYYVSEGYSRKWINQKKGHSYRSEIVNHDQKILDDMELCFRELGIKIDRTKKSVQSNTKMSYLIFKHILKAGSNAYEKAVPGLVLNGSKGIQNNFLHAYFLGDGCYMKKQKMYRFTTISKRLADGLVFLLMTLGFQDVTLSQDTKFYRIHVWSEIPIIGLMEDKTKNRHFSRSIPGRFLEKEIRALKDIGYYHCIKKRISKEKLEAFYADYKEKFDRSEKIERFLGLFESDFAFDTVVGIEEQRGQQHVYDLSVEDAENFIGGHGWTCLHNSFYGYLGYARSRYYSRPCAESVTAWGRKHINETIESAGNMGFSVLYADTDSVFLLFKEKQRVLEFMKDVNSRLPEKMELELEGFYPRGVFVSKKGGESRGAKKKYALIAEDGRIKIRGFELVRRDWSDIAKDTQLKVLEAILKEGSKEKAVRIVRETIEQLQGGRVPLGMLAISTQLNKEPGSYEVKSPELSAAKKMLKAGIHVEKGTLISYVVGKKGASISEKAVPLELATDYDTDYYINNQVLPAVMKILKELGYDEYSMKVGGKQESLDSYF